LTFAHLPGIHRKGGGVTNNRCQAFTLVEVLMVVIIMAVLAAVILPQFASTTTTARESALTLNLGVMRAQLELYKYDHDWTPPSAANYANQMSEYTDVNGNAVTIADKSHHYGPYIQSVPANPFNGSSAVTGCSGTPTAEVAGFGWQYDQTTGRIYPNTAGYFDW
jgi:prepilin-type N-terminal cleavage/methylation domain-containing protein